MDIFSWRGFVLKALSIASQFMESKVVSSMWRKVPFFSINDDAAAVYVLKNGFTGR